VRCGARRGLSRAARWGRGRLHARRGRAPACGREDENAWELPDCSTLMCSHWTASKSATSRLVEAYSAPSVRRAAPTSRPSPAAPAS
jgi:hypothetical protein